MAGTRITLKKKDKDKEDLWKWAFEYIQQPGKIELIMKTALGYWAIVSSILFLTFLTASILGWLNGNFNGIAIFFTCIFGYGTYKTWPAFIKYLRVCKAVQKK